MEKGEEAAIELEPGKTLVVKFLTVGEPHPDGSRTVFFELNGQPREVTVVDRSLKVEKRERRKANPAAPGEVGAPIPGAVTNVVVELGDTVEKGRAPAGHGGHENADDGLRPAVRKGTRAIRECRRNC